MNLLLLVTTAMAQEAAAAAPEAAHTFSMSAMWTDAGPVAKVVIVMLGVMLVMVVLVAIERMIAFGKATSQSRLLAAEIVPHLQKNDLAAALTVTKNDAYKASYLGALLRAGLVEMNERSDRHGIENAHRAVSKASGQEVSKLRRGMSLLATVGSTAPFVGLFGTTTGVINAFSGMATQGGAGLAGISAGISEALITTAFGIAVAVVGVWVFNYFNTRIDKFTEELASSEADFIDWAEKLLQKRGQA
jgi:biopolymer transport protein ExbB/biopolymer transport protein TolQ